MKIGSPEIKPGPMPPTPAPSKERVASGGPAGNATGAEPSAKVELSSAATLGGATAADPAFDTAKVDRIAQAIRDGKFEVNAEAIADKLITNAAELLGRKAN